MVAEIDSPPSCLPASLGLPACRGAGEGRTSCPIPLGQLPARQPRACGEEAEDDLMAAAAVNHSPDHIPTSLGVGKPVGAQRCSSTPTAVGKFQEPTELSPADQRQGWA